jgi:BirA family transcriptional regulator, biotin operon repressor / biotin---[acetyl-CoA-carboxylase] ligase
VSDPLDAGAVDRSLQGRWGRPLELLQTTGSTNDVALAWALRGAPEGATVVAEHQTAGRGRRGRSWTSPAGTNLLFSVVLRPDGPSAGLGLLATAAGLATSEGIESLVGLRCGLKWPNDVTIEGRKVAGILVETRVSSSVATVAVVGIGINVGWHPKDVAEAPGTTSIVAHGRAAARHELLAAVLARLETLYELSRDPEGAEGLAARAAARSDLLGRRVRVRRGDGTALEGTATALLASGALEIDGRGISSVEVDRVRPA